MKADIGVTMKRIVLFAALIAVSPLAFSETFIVQAPDEVFRDGFEEEGGGGGPLDPCLDPLVAPPGWTIITKTWKQAFSAPDGSPVAIYPNGVGFPVPLPGRYPNGSVTDMIPKGTITTIPFVAQPNTTTTLTWDIAQANGSQGYPAPRPAEIMFIGVSECKADVRILPDSDPCSKVAGGASLFTTTKVASPAVCQLEAGKQYYYNVMMANPSDGLTFGEHSCSNVAPNSANGCDVQARVTSVVSP